MREGQQYFIVDDDSTNNLICNFTIRKYDKHARIEAFINPENALNAIAEKIRNTGNNRPMVLFLDVNMPAMTGFEFLDALKNKIDFQKKLRIYILSSSIEDFSLQAKKYPFVHGFLAKPLKVSHLEEIWKKEPGLELSPVISGIKSWKKDGNLYFLQKKG